VASIHSIIGGQPSPHPHLGQLQRLLLSTVCPTYWQLSQLWAPTKIIKGPRPRGPYGSTPWPPYLFHSTRCVTRPHGWRNGVQSGLDAGVAIKRLRVRLQVLERLRKGGTPRVPLVVDLSDNKLYNKIHNKSTTNPQLIEQLEFGLNDSVGKSFTPLWPCHQAV